ncbi:MAG: GNAT family N-acetyltransferase [Bacteroidota bacterium]|nr:GNAT family N-acetyltransferase [Bacteroidota bacterium]
MHSSNFLLTGQQSNRLLFRKLQQSDFEHWLAFCSDPTSLEYIFFAQSTPGDPAVKCRQWFERIFYRYENNLGGLNVLIDKNTNEFIGQCGLLIQTVDGKEEMEIGYSLMPQHRKKGYAMEAASKCRDFAFENDFRDALISIIHIDNVNSAKVAIANGMMKEKQTVYMDNPVNIFRITKETWMNNFK